MNVIKKLTVSILIVCMFLRLPQGEAMASETVDNFIAAAMDLDDLSIDSNQADCNGFYTIFSPCHTAQMNTSDSNVGGIVTIYDTLSYDQLLMYDENRTLPWNHESEPPSGGFLIPVLHF